MDGIEIFMLFFNALIDILLHGLEWGRESCPERSDATTTGISRKLKKFKKLKGWLII